MSVEQMRAYLKGLYHGAPTWCIRVDKMPDAQVMAIYFRITRPHVKN